MVAEKKGGVEEGEEEQGDEGGADGLGDAEPGGCGHGPAEGLGGVLVDEGFGDGGQAGGEEDGEAEAEPGVAKEVDDFGVPG